MFKTTTHFLSFVVFICLNFYPCLSQTSTLLESEYHFIYKISPQDNYSYEANIGSAKETQNKLRKLFNSIYSWYDNSENVFYVKCLDTLRPIQDYTDLLASKSFLLASPIEIYEININNPFPSDAYNYKYTLHLQGDFSNWKSKSIVDTLNTLFQTDASWYNSSENVFYIKTVDQSKTILEYTQLLEDSSLILSQALSITYIKTGILNSEIIK